MPPVVVRVITVSGLQGYLRRVPPGGRPHELARLPDSQHTLLAAWNDLWNQLFESDLPPLLGQQLTQHYGASAETLAVGLLTGWLFQEPGLASALNHTERHARLLQVLFTDQPAWLQEVPALSLWQNAERQEEWIRLWLRGLGLQPEDESPDISERRWLRISSVHQAKLLAALTAHQVRQTAIKAAQTRLKRLEQGE
ncbi:MAG: hypothetical protein ACO1RX_10635 [Candidatus Sericytochromatia bacterium]